MKLNWAPELIKALIRNNGIVDAGWARPEGRSYAEGCAHRVLIQAGSDPHRVSHAMLTRWLERESGDIRLVTVGKPNQDVNLETKQ